MTARVLAVHRAPEHTFTKQSAESIELIEGIGVRGDAHAGATVQHRSRVARDPAQPNLRQVHLIHAELLARLAAAGYEVPPGAMGENITTEGLDLLALPAGTRLRIGADAEVTVTGLRNPCQQINDFRPGLVKQVLRRGDDGEVHRLAGVMAIVSHGGTVRPRDGIVVDLPAAPHRGLEPV